VVIEVRYLRGGLWVKGRSLIWPPPPALLFSALVNAWGTRGEDRQEEEALLWLEDTPPPDIYAPPLGKPTLLHTFVPPNEFVVDKRTKELVRKRTPLEFTSAFIQGEPVVAYRLMEEAPDHLVDPLRALASRVNRLGNTLNPVEVRLVEKAEKPNWVPGSSSKKPDLLLKVWNRGLLQELKRRYERMHLIHQGLTGTFTGRTWEPIMAKWVPYRPKAGATEEVSSPISFQAVLGLKPSLPLAYWYPLARKLHEEFAKEHSGKKVFFVPMPFVGHPYADGRILGVGILSEGPRGDFQIAAHARALAKKDGFLSSPWELRLYSESVYEQASLSSERWSQPSHIWASVTPVVWPRTRQHPEDILTQLVREQGLPDPTLVQAGPFPYAKGVPEVWAFQPYLPSPNGKHLVFHVRLEFSHPVPGPILLGKEQEMGMGFLVPLGGSEKQI